MRRWTGNTMVTIAVLALLACESKDDAEESKDLRAVTAPAAEGTKPEVEDPPPAPSPDAPPAQVTPAGKRAVMEEPCGKKGLPDCPLQAWMLESARKPSEDGDLAAVAASMKKLADFAPTATWNEGDEGWATIARTVAAAAEAKDRGAVKRQCKHCHSTFRKRYKAEYRNVMLP